MPGKIVSNSEWLEARKELLVQEKAALRSHMELREKMRSFPMVEVTKPYTFTSVSDKTSNISLSDLFAGRKQLIVYHFMLGPGKEIGCDGCSFLVDNLPSTLAHLNHRDTTLVLVSRAPAEEIEKFQKRMGWTFPWYSSFDSDFNYDYGVSMDPDKGTAPYNYKEKKPGDPPSTYKGELPGLSIFYKEDGNVYHTYSTYARGVEGMLVTYSLLDMTPLGRQEIVGTPEADWKLHDEY